MAEKVFIANVSELPLKMGLKVKNGSQTIGIFKLDETTIYAIGNVCPHAQGPLSEGMVTGHEVICPLHGLHVDLITGKPINDDTLADVPTYETVIEDGKLYIMV